MGTMDDPHLVSLPDGVRIYGTPAWPFNLNKLLNGVCYQIMDGVVVVGKTQHTYHKGKLIASSAPY